MGPRIWLGNDFQKKKIIDRRSQLSRAINFSGERDKLSIAVDIHQRRQSKTWAKHGVIERNSVDTVRPVHEQAVFQLTVQPDAFT